MIKDGGGGRRERRKENRKLVDESRKRPHRKIHNIYNPNNI